MKTVSIEEFKKLLDEHDWYFQLRNYGAMTEQAGKDGFGVLDYSSGLHTWKRIQALVNNDPILRVVYREYVKEHGLGMQ